MHPCFHKHRIWETVSCFSSSISSFSFSLPHFLSPSFLGPRFMTHLNMSVPEVKIVKHYVMSTQAIYENLAANLSQLIKVFLTSITTA